MMDSIHAFTVFISTLSIYLCGMSCLAYSAVWIANKTFETVLKLIWVWPAVVRFLSRTKSGKLPYIVSGVQKVEDTMNVALDALEFRDISEENTEHIINMHKLQLPDYYRSLARQARDVQAALRSLSKSLVEGGHNHGWYQGRGSKRGR